jgi:hypothetical protein
MRTVDAALHCNALQVESLANITELHEALLGSMASCAAHKVSCRCLCATRCTAALQVESLANITELHEPLALDGKRPHVLFKTPAADDSVALQMQVESLANIAQLHEPLALDGTTTPCAFSNCLLLMIQVALRMRVESVANTTELHEPLVLDGKRPHVLFKTHVADDSDVLQMQVESLANITELHEPLALDGSMAPGAGSNRAAFDGDEEYDSWRGRDFGIWSIAWSPQGGQLIAGQPGVPVYGHHHLSEHTQTLRWTLSAHNIAAVLAL